MWLQGWNFQPLLPYPQKGRGAGELNSVTHGQWFNQSCLCNGISIKTLSKGIWRASELVNTWRFWESGAWRGNGNADFCSWIVSFYNKIEETIRVYILLTQVLHSFKSIFFEEHLDSSYKLKISKLQEIIDNINDDFVYEYKQVIRLFLNYRRKMQFFQ